MNKLQYVVPVAEEVSALLCACILEASGDGDREGYPYGGEFDW